MVNGKWIPAATGLSHAKAMRESLAFTRFRIVEEKRAYDVIARETLLHRYTVEAGSFKEAEELALEGCPIPDADCESEEFAIASVTRQKRGKESRL